MDNRTGVDMPEREDIVEVSLLDILQWVLEYGFDHSRAVQSGSSQLPRSDVTLTSPIQPGKVICVGMNYADHCQEMGQAPPTEPVTFSKFPSTVIGPHDDIPYPEVGHGNLSLIGKYVSKWMSELVNELVGWLVSGWMS